MRDDRYRAEFRTVCRAVQKHIEVLARIAADWANCPTELEDILAARGDRHASAERVRQDAFAEAARAIERVAKSWAERIAQGAYQGEMLRAADIRRDEGVDIAKLIRTLGALPPSTGEKVSGE